MKSGNKKKFIFLLLFSVYCISSYSQFEFIGVMSDTCENYKGVYTIKYESMGNPHQGSKSTVLKNGVPIMTTGSGDGCCYIGDIKPLTDDVIFVDILRQGMGFIQRTRDGGKTWEAFQEIGVVEYPSVRFFSENTGYGLSGYYKVYIRRFSDVKPMEIYYEEIDTSIKEVFIQDTIFGEPYCPGINELVYRIKKDGVFIDYHIVFSEIVVDVKTIERDTQPEIFPNPSNSAFKINLDFDCVMEIVDQYGRTIQRIALYKGQNTIDVGLFHPGFYSVKFQSKSGVFTKSFIKY